MLRSTGVYDTSAAAALAAGDGQFDSGKEEDEKQARERKRANTRQESLMQRENFVPFSRTCRAVADRQRCVRGLLASAAFYVYSNREAVSCQRAMTTTEAAAQPWVVRHDFY